MKILTIPGIKELDQYTIKNEPISSFDLMERAASQCTQWICKNYTNKKTIAIVCGPGNNGGDGFAIARLLNEKGYTVSCYKIKFSNHKSEDNRKQEKLFSKDHELITIQNTNDLKKIKGDLIVDALFGSGLSRTLEGDWAKLTHHLNSLNAPIISIDSPSGLFMDTETASDSAAIKASVCLSLQLLKKGMLIAENEKHLGQVHLIDIGLSKKGITLTDTKDFYLEEKDVKKIYKPRRKHSHKGDYGHALIVSGSKGMIGATVLMAKACLRTGVGLLTIHAPNCAYNILQSAIPEAMTQCDEENDYISKIPFKEKHNIGIGPGIGKNKRTMDALSKLLSEVNAPLLLDADALNIIATKNELISKIPKNSILTPHKKEAARLLNASMKGWELHEKARKFAINHQVYFVLKGAHSQIHCPNGNCYFNSTGNPGMATAGSGDVLSGIIISLLAQGYTSKNASLLGVYMHGLAGDIMVKEISQESLSASDIINGIPLAYKYLKKD
jgi:NAD(P)H-hydrate epimerase